MYLEGRKQFTVKTPPSLDIGNEPNWNEMLYLPLPPFYESCSSLFINLLCDV